MTHRVGVLWNPRKPAGRRPAINILRRAARAVSDAGPRRRVQALGRSGVLGGRYAALALDVAIPNDIPMLGINPGVGFLSEVEPDRLRRIYRSSAARSWKPMILEIEGRAPSACSR